MIAVLGALRFVDQSRWVSARSEIHAIITICKYSFVFQGNYLSQDRELIASMVREGNRDGVQIWQLATGQPYRIFLFPNIFCFALSLDGTVLVAGNEDLCHRHDIFEKENPWF
jgi:hypothetical protein